MRSEKREVCKIGKSEGVSAEVEVGKMIIIKTMYTDLSVTSKK